MRTMCSIRGAFTTVKSASRIAAIYRLNVKTLVGLQSAIDIVDARVNFDSTVTRAVFENRTDSNNILQ